MDPCKDFSPDSEPAHERDLYALEEEIRSKRRSLQSRLFYEHCLQQKKLEAEIAELEKECNKLEDEIYGQIEEMELHNQTFKSRIEMLQQCLEGRKKDLRGAFDAEVARIMETMNSVKQELKALQGEKPGIDKRLAELKGHAAGDDKKPKGDSIESLEKKLSALKDKITRTLRQQNEEVSKLQKDLENQVVMMDDEIINSEDDMADQKEALRNLGMEHASKIDELEYQIHRLEEMVAKEKEDFANSTTEEKIRKEIADLEDEIKKQPTSFQYIKKESDDLRSRLVISITEKLKSQENDINTDRQDLARSLSDIDSKLKALQKEQAGLPKELEDRKKEILDQFKKRLDKANQRKADKASVHSQRMQEAKENFASSTKDIQQLLTDLLSQLSNTKKSGAEKLTGLRNQIKALENKLPALEEDEKRIDNENIKNIGTMSGKIVEWLWRADTLRNSDGLRGLYENIEQKLDRLLHNFHEKSQREIESKEKEVEKLVRMAEELEKQLISRDRQHIEEVKPLQDEVSNLTEAAQTIHESNAKIEDAIKNDKTYEDFVDAANSNKKKSSENFSAEVNRLQKLIDDESFDHENSCEQIKQSIEKAEASQKEHQRSHSEEIAELEKKLEEREKLVSEAREQQRQVVEMYSKIETLETKITKIREETETIKTAETEIHQLREEKESLLDKRHAGLQAGKEAGELEDLIMNIDAEIHELYEKGNPQLMAPLQLELVELTSINGKLQRKVDIVTNKLYDAAKVLTKRLNYLHAMSDTQTNNTQDHEEQTMNKHLRRLVQENEILRKTINDTRPSIANPISDSEPSDIFTNVDLRFKVDETEPMTGKESVRSLVQRFQKHSLGAQSSHPVQSKLRKQNFHYRKIK